MILNPYFNVEPMFLGKTFDDFTLNPQCSKTEHRNAILKTNFSQNVTLNLPVVSANMRTVTGPAMAISMAQEGGIGILPRGIPIELQTNWVKEVKRVENFIIKDPYTIHVLKTLNEAKQLMKIHDVSTLLVVNSSAKLVGILSARGRMKLCGNTDGNKIVVGDLMTKITEDHYTTREAIDSTEIAAEELRKYGKETLPWLEPSGRIRGLMTMKDISDLLQNKWANKDSKGRLIVGATIGATSDYIERAAELIRAEVDVIVMDTAHAHNSVVVIPAIEEFRKNFGQFELVCGNVATFEGARFLSGLVQGIKVGIGPGAGCQTRNETGVGVGQLDAIRSAYYGSARLPCIADGGVRKPGDISKALLTGASCVMLGEFLAGTDESPGKTINDPKKGRIKIYGGETSPQAKLSGLEYSGKIKNVEGSQKEVTYQGSVKDVLRRIRESLQSMVSYMGEEDLATVMTKVREEPWLYFRPASLATQRESFDK